MHDILCRACTCMHLGAHRISWEGHNDGGVAPGIDQGLDDCANDAPACSPDPHGWDDDALRYQAQRYQFRRG